MLHSRETNYKSKYLKYKTKYLELEQKYKMKKQMRGGEQTLEDRLRLIPANFPKQSSMISKFYDYTGNPVTNVTRFEFPNVESKDWSVKLDNYEPMYFDSAKTLYHSIVNFEDKFWNPKHYLETEEELAYVEMGVGANWGKLIHVRRGGWADPEDINQKIGPTPPMPPGPLADGVNMNKIRVVNMSVREEIDLCESLLNKLMLINKKKYGNDMNDKKLKMDCINEVSNICKNLGIKLRVSFTGKIEFDEYSNPKNPAGRTGLRGRGELGNWGPNHAADPVVCRINNETNLLEFALVYRSQDSKWALPGGMVEAGQTISDTRTQEFAEEAMGVEELHELKDSELSPEQLIMKKERMREIINSLKTIFGSFKSDDILYQGVVDDHRNTDNSHMETTAVMTFLGYDSNVKLKAGSDAGKVTWYPYNSKIELFASHKLFVDLAVDKLLKNGQIVQADENEIEQLIENDVIPRDSIENGINYFVGVGVGVGVGIGADLNMNMEPQENLTENMEIAEVKFQPQFQSQLPDESTNSNKRARYFGGKKINK